MTKEETLAKLAWAITSLREMADELQATKSVIEKINVDIDPSDIQMVNQDTDNFLEMANVVKMMAEEYVAGYKLTNNLPE
jgi:hypothetical protein